MFRLEDVERRASGPCSWQVGQEPWREGLGEQRGQERRSVAAGV